jgi:hypothetical protein
LSEADRQSRLFSREIERAIEKAIGLLQAGEFDECELNLEEIRVAAGESVAPIQPSRVGLALDLLRIGKREECGRELEELRFKCRAAARE